ncbi:MAG: aminotransferase class V-fold PLP-dependent enzyme [Thermoproteota archaeon]|nr:aminotransferase class V-fold PLP-dependent enzyme [Thermoproteota archaeon]
MNGRPKWNRQGILYAKFIGADSREEIAFTHSTSEGMNIIAHMLSDKGIVISNELEFPSSNLPWLNKDKDNIKFVKARDDNKIIIEDIAKMVNHNGKTKHWSPVMCSILLASDKV